MPWRRILPWLLGGGVSLALLFALFMHLRSQPKSEGRFLTMKTSRGPLQARVTANGTLSALVTVQVGSQVSGRIQTLDVDFNSPVKKGQRCAQIDPLLFEAALAQAKANRLAAAGALAKDLAQADYAKVQFGRESELGEQHLVAQADVDNARTTMLAAQAQVEADRGALAQAEATQHQAQINLDYTRIVSPIDGIVVSRNVDVGQTVAAAFQAPTLFLIAEDLKKMQVDTNIAEADVGRLRDGMRAAFTVDAYPNDSFVGVVRQVRKNPQTIQNVVTYDAVLDVENADLRLFPGMTANVSLVYADRPAVLRLPNQALRYRPPPDVSKGRTLPAVEGDRRLVWVLKDGMPEPKVVEIGVSDGTSTEVLGGLEEGEEVIAETAGSRPGGPGSFGRVF